MTAVERLAMEIKAIAGIFMLEMARRLVHKAELDDLQGKLAPSTRSEVYKWVSSALANVKQGGRDDLAEQYAKAMMQWTALFGDDVALFQDWRVVGRRPALPAPVARARRARHRCRRRRDPPAGAGSRAAAELAAHRGGGSARISRRRRFPRNHTREPLVEGGPVGASTAHRTRTPSQTPEALPRPAH